MCSGNGEKKNGDVKIFDERFEHLYGEKIYYISKRDRQSLCTGYRPDEKGHFHFCLRLTDHRRGNVLTFTLFQFVRLMKDLREVLFTEGELKDLYNVDESLQFKFSEVIVPTVIVEVDASIPIPNLFQLNLRNNYAASFTSIVCTRKTLRKLGELEGEFIGTIETLEDKTCNFMFKTFVSKCVSHLTENKTPIDSMKMYQEIKLMSKTPYQTEVFLKFWELICLLITHKMCS